MSAILKLNNVSYQFEDGKKNVLQKISAEFQKGKLYAIMGKSGAGKSTLLSLISGLDLCTDGKIEFDGRDMRELDRDQYRARSIGVIFQGYNLLTNATALDNVVLSMNISGVKSAHKKDDALALLSKVGINEEKARRSVLKLSGGEQQRVGIARALAHHPEVVIADEPTGNLDTKASCEIMNLLKRSNHELDQTIVMITHNMELAKAADRTIMIEDGKIK